MTFFSKWLLIGLMLALMTACSVKTAQNIARYPMSFFQALIGYVPPPHETSVLEELREEHERCLRAGGSDEQCTEEAYAFVRKYKKVDQPDLPVQGSVEIGDETEVSPP